MNKLKQTKGITLVALVLTIIILLILAAISIQALTNQGLFGRANNAKRESEIANIKEQIALDIYEKQLEPPVGSITEDQLKTILEKQGTIIYEEDGVTIKGITTTDKGYEILLSDIYSGTTEEAETPPDPSLPTNPSTTIAEAQSDYMLTKTVNSEITDEFGNRITVPAGFKIKVDDTTNNATTVNKGIVIIDSNENEFVWIPTGKIYTDTEKTEENAKTIELNRYTFDSSGNPTAQNDAVIESYYQELATSTLGNTTAKDINDFKTKASATGSGGFYIGRYEARTATARSASGNTLTTLTTKASDYVYNWVTQIQAADLARNMYKDATTFTSDLMNSYAWDTATLFLQIFGTDSTYSRKTSVNTGSLATTGTNNQTTKDVQCNVYDMASNVFEWTTETSSDSFGPCVFRGGRYDISGYYTSRRKNCNTSVSGIYDGFRPLLYV